MCGRRPPAVHSLSEERGLGETHSPSGGESQLSKNCTWDCVEEAHVWELLYSRTSPSRAGKSHGV